MEKEKRSHHQTFFFWKEKQTRRKRRDLRNYLNDWTYDWIRNCTQLWIRLPVWLEDVWISQVTNTSRRFWVLLWNGTLANGACFIPTSCCCPFSQNLVMLVFQLHLQTSAGEDLSKSCPLGHWQFNAPKKEFYLRRLVDPKPNSECWTLIRPPNWNLCYHSQGNWLRSRLHQTPLNLCCCRLMTSPEHSLYRYECLSTSRSP